MGRPKLLVIVGAGASIDLGMPSTAGIDVLFASHADAQFSTPDGSGNLYTWIRDRLTALYDQEVNDALRKRVNFEEMLYVLLQLNAMLQSRHLRMPLKAFVDPIQTPEIVRFGKVRHADADDCRELAQQLVDVLVDEFRGRCIGMDTSVSSGFETLRGLLTALGDEFQLSFVNLNYDNGISQAVPGLFTGFRASDDTFDPDAVWRHEDWNVLYHLHGSVHFDLVNEPEFHTVVWKRDLSASFAGGAAGRNVTDTTEEVPTLNSVVIAGYAKTVQVQRMPFRTYYAQLDRLTAGADALLFLGYGFGDDHVNNSIRASLLVDRRVPIVVVDRASERQDPVALSNSAWATSLCHTLRLSQGWMMSRQGATPMVDELIDDGEFEVSRNTARPAAIWYGGIQSLSGNVPAILAELRS